MLVIGVDPGKTTGVAFRKEAVGFGEYTQDMIWSVLTAMKPTMIVCEKFMYRPNRAADLEAVEVIGIVKEWARQYHSSVTFQTPHQAKHFWTNERLKAEGLYRPGMPHAMDALRHLLYYQTFGKGAIK